MRVLVLDGIHNMELAYDVEDEVMGNPGISGCEACPKYEECQGWAEIFGKCNGNPSGI